MQTKVPCQQADIRAEKTFPESKLRGRRMEQSRGGNKATSPWNTCQKKDCTSTPQEAKELLYPVWTGKEFLSSTAACMKFTENGALLLFPQFEEISSHGPRIHFRLALYNGRNISERIKKKKIRKRREKGRREDSSAILLRRGESQRGREQERGESHRIHTPPVPPPGPSRGVQSCRKTGLKHNFY